MKITITFEIPEKDWKSAIRYWKSIKAPITWKEWLHQNIKSSFSAKNIKIGIEK